MAQITGWFLKGINFEDAPGSLDDLRAMSRHVVLERDDLLQAAKWEPLLQGRKVQSSPGWVALDTLASFRRGIATGANGFFLLSKDQLSALGISRERCLPCVGRANDVPKLIYRTSDFNAGVAEGGKLFLLNLADPLSTAEMRYVQIGESEGLTARYILANRRPWYSMEQRPVAPIWAAVFGRGDLKFVSNEAGVRSLTNFHCIYPSSPDKAFHRALVLCLNASSVREASKLHGRIYGGGLNKFEPNDLKAIQVPDLRAVGSTTLDAMSDLLTALDANPDDAALKRRADELCADAAEIAAAG